jgi:L-lactate dehydrogenase (cytochrome)
MLGRTWVYALAARGEAGVTELLEMFEREIHIAMTQTGRTDIASLSREILSEIK